jgi:hypothetical protein
LNRRKLVKIGGITLKSEGGRRWANNKILQST